MSKKAPTGGLIGVALLAVGAAGMAWTNIRDFSPDALWRVAFIAGVILICYGRLVMRTAASEDLYRIGYDIGYEAGHQAGRAAGRPVVVDLNDRREGSNHAPSSGSRAVDRV